MLNFIYGIATVLVAIGFLTLICHWAGLLRTKANERQAVDEFCKDRNYCFYGCGGGHGHDDEDYYGGYNCSSDHK